MLTDNDAGEQLLTVGLVLVGQDTGLRAAVHQPTTQFHGTQDKSLTVS
jgi:hypothetical protein